MPADSIALRLSARIDALAAALLDAGVVPERSARLLGAAATAALYATTLDALLEREPRVVAQPATLVLAESAPPVPESIAA